MKKILLFLVIIMIVSVKLFAQDAQQQIKLSELLTRYYSIKDALVSGSNANASTSAEQFIKTLNTIDYKVVSEGNVNALLKDATSISETKDIKRQRDQFANLSTNMAALAKAVKLSSSAIYQVYCPMKKANWLSSEQIIKNPYYGNAMLSCGKVVETIQ